MPTDASFHDTAEPAKRPRHPCCAGPDDSNPVTDVTHPTPLHRPTLAQDRQTTTGRDGTMTGKGEDQ